MIHGNNSSSWSTLFWSVEHSHKVCISNSYASETVGDVILWSAKIGRCARCSDDCFQHWSPRSAYKIADNWHVSLYWRFKVSGFWIPLRSAAKGRNTLFAPFPPIAIFDVLKTDVFPTDSVATFPSVWPKWNDGLGLVQPSLVIWARVYGCSMEDPKEQRLPTSSHVR